MFSAGMKVETGRDDKLNLSEINLNNSPRKFEREAQ